MTANGVSQKQIAEALGVSPSTIVRWSMKPEFKQRVREYADSNRKADQTEASKIRQARLKGFRLGVSRLIRAVDDPKVGRTQVTAAAALTRLLPPPVREERPVIDLLRDMLKHLPAELVDEYSRRIDEIEAL